MKLNLTLRPAVPGQEISDDTVAKLQALLFKDGFNYRLTRDGQLVVEGHKEMGEIDLASFRARIKEFLIETGIDLVGDIETDKFYGDLEGLDYTFYGLQALLAKKSIPAQETVVKRMGELSSQSVERPILMVIAQRARTGETHRDTDRPLFVYHSPATGRLYMSPGHKQTLLELLQSKSPDELEETVSG